MLLIDKINKYYTSTASTDFISYLLTNSVKKFIYHVPRSILTKYSNFSSINGYIDVLDKIVLEVIVSGKEPRTIPYSKFMQAKDPNSIHFASEFDPVIAIKGKYLYCYPEEGEIIYYSIPNVNYNDSNINPLEIEDLVIIDVVLSLINAKLQEFTSLISQIDLVEVEAPIIPEPNFVYTNPVFNSIVETTINTETPPTYSLTLTESTQSNISLPVLPDLDSPAFAVANASSEIPLMTIDISTLYSNLQEAINLEDLELAQTIIAQIQVKISEWNNSVSLYLQSKQSDISENQIEVNKQIAQYQNLVSKFTFDLEKAYKAIEFSLNQNRLNLEINVSNANMKLQNELNRFNSEMDKYKTKLQYNLEKAKFAQERLSIISKTENDFNIANEAKQLEKQVSEYQMQLGKYQNEVAIYSQKVVEEFNKAKFEIDKLTLQIGELKDLYNGYSAKLNSLLQLILGVNNGSSQEGNLGNNNTATS